MGGLVKGKVSSRRAEGRRVWGWDKGGRSRVVGEREIGGRRGGGWRVLWVRILVWFTQDGGLGVGFGS